MKTFKTLQFIFGKFNKWHNHILRWINLINNIPLKLEINNKRTIHFFWQVLKCNRREYS
jgi:hypothetical protein